MCRTGGGSSSPLRFEFWFGGERLVVVTVEDDESYFVVVGVDEGCITGWSWKRN